jgi:membrane protein
MTPESRGRTGADSGSRADYRPVGSDPKPSTFATVKRTIKEFSEDNLTDWAAALTYYGLYWPCFRR